MKPIVLAELAGSAGYGGGERYLELLLERVDRTRFRPLLICPEPGPFVGRMGSRGIPTRVVHLSPLVNPLALVRLVRLLKREGVTILQTHGARANVYGRLAGWMAGVPCVVSTVHNSIRDYEVGRFKQWLYRAVLRLTLPLVHRIICVSDATRRDVLADAPEAAERVTTVRNGVDLASFDRLSHRETIQKDWCFGNGPVLLTVARLTEQKGHRYLIEALPGLLREWSTLSCVFVGEGECRESLRALARDAGVDHACRFVGSRDDVIDWYEAADVVVLPSLSEGFPFVILEALAMSRPVVATQVNGVPEIIEDGCTGLLVPPRDAQALEIAIRRMLRDQASAIQMGRAGRSRVASQFTVERMLAETVRVFEQSLLPSSRGARGAEREAA